MIASEVSSKSQLFGDRRHFGGTKLGTGGLARAYGGAAKECLQLAEKTTFHRQANVHVKVAEYRCRIMRMLCSATLCTYLEMFHEPT